MSTATAVATARPAITGARTALWRTGVIALTCDLCAIALSLFAALAVEGSLRDVHFHDLAWNLAGAGAAWLFGAALLRHYEADRPRRGRLEEAGAVTLLAAGVAIFEALAAWALPETQALPGADWFAVSLLPMALVLRLFVFRRLAAGRPVEALIVGAGPLAVAAAESLRRAKRFEVCGHLTFTHERAPARTKVLGAARDVEALLRRRPVSEVYIAADPARESAEMQRVVHVCEQLGMPFALPAWTLRIEVGRPVRSQRVDDGFVHFRCVEPGARLRLALKHVFDLYAAALALFLLGPFLLAVAALVKLDSKGPSLFRQPRVGQHGRAFGMLKFRSMVQDAEKLREALEERNECAGPVFKMKRDPRITRVGRVLRKYSIDELPQLLNVLRGEMSVVGPRPPIASEVAQYEPWQLRRLSVRPGLTCIWQVTGRSQVSFHDWMLLDLRYIDTWKLRGDFSLIARTVPAVISGRGAS